MNSQRERKTAGQSLSPVNLQSSLWLCAPWKDPCRFTLLEEGGCSIPAHCEVQGWLMALLDSSLMEQMPVVLMCFGE